MSFLSVNPTSGTAPAGVSVSVDITGLAAGTYNGTITVSATGATNTPVNVSVTLNVAQAPTPTIAVSPTSFTFTGVAGGANPASQNLSITNSGTGTLSFTVSDDMSFLSVNPTSGTAPASVTVSVSTAGLAAGTYTGTVTVSATGATNTPVNIPVTLTVTAASTQLITNGGFETSATSAAPWSISGNASLVSTTNGTGSFPHTGTNYVFLDNADNASGTAFQQITIPSGTSPNLTFWLNITSQETTTSTQYDKLFIEVRNSSGTLLATLATFSNLSKGTAGVYSQKSFSLANFAGQTVRVQFRGTTDFSLVTIFRIDDVSVK